MFRDRSTEDNSRTTLHAEDGTTIVEMLVTTFVLGLGVMGVAMLLISSARSASLAEVQRDATALAASEVEIIRSLDYDAIGVSPLADGFVPTLDGLPTVIESTVNLVEPLSKIAIGDITFLITRSVTWATVGSDREAYKVVTVEVEWESPSGPRSVQIQTGVHEGLTGV